MYIQLTVVVNAEAYYKHAKNVLHAHAHVHVHCTYMYMYMYCMHIHTLHVHVHVHATASFTLVEVTNLLKAVLIFSCVVPFISVMKYEHSCKLLTNYDL